MLPGKNSSDTSVLIDITSKSVFSTEPASEEGLPEVDTFGLALGLNLPELSTSTVSLSSLFRTPAVK